MRRPGAAYCYCYYYDYSYSYDNNNYYHDDDDDDHYYYYYHHYLISCCYDYYYYYFISPPRKTPRVAQAQQLVDSVAAAGAPAWPSRMLRARTKGSEPNDLRIPSIWGRSTNKHNTAEKPCPCMTYHADWTQAGCGLPLRHPRGYSALSQELDRLEGLPSVLTDASEICSASRHCLTAFSRPSFCRRSMQELRPASAFLRVFSLARWEFRWQEHEV